VEDELAGSIGRQPRREEYDTEESFDDAIREYMDALKREPSYRTWYDEHIEPTLGISQHVGNWYTGSVHIARAAALYHAAETGQDLAGDRLLVGSYGSGAPAAVHPSTGSGSATTSPSRSTSAFTTATTTRSSPNSIRSPRPRTSSSSTDGVG